MTAPIAALVRRLTCDQQSATDAHLLTRYAATRDQTAFELLVWRHAGAVWATCRRMLSPDRAAAEDACQAAFLALALHANRLRQSAAVAGWLRKVAVRACLDLQGRKRTAPLPADPSSVSREPGQTAADAELRAALDDGLNQLPERFRLPFVLCEVDGMSNAEAAAVLGCAVGTVESRLTRARQRLRRFLTAKGVQPAVLAGTLAIPDAVRASLFNVHPESASHGVRELAARAVGGGLLTKLRAAVAVGVLLVASAVGFGVMPGETPARAPQPPETAPPPRLAEVPAVAEPRVPVPEGVVRRLGSPRLRHPAWVTDIAFSQDGKRIATVGYDKTVRVWDAETGAETNSTPLAMKSVPGAVLPIESTQVAFADGGKAIFATVAAGYVLELMRIDTKTGASDSAGLFASRKGSAKIWFSPDGSQYVRQVVGTEQSNGISANDTISRSIVRQLPPEGNAQPYTLAAVSPDGKEYALASDGALTRVWFDKDIPRVNYYTPARRNDTPKMPLYDRLVFSPNGEALFAREKTQDLLIAWDVKSHKELWRCQNPNAETALLPALGGKVLVCVGQRMAAGTVDAATGKETGVRFKTALGCTCAAMHPNGKVVAMANTSGAITLFDVATGEPVFPTADPPRAVEDVRFSRDGKSVYGWAADWVKWDTRTGRQTTLTNTGWNYGDRLSPDGQFTARSEVLYFGIRIAGDDDSPHVRLAITRTADGKPFNTFDGKQYDCKWLDFTPDSKAVIGAGQDGIVRVWDIMTGEVVVSLKGHPQPPSTHAISADGRVLVTATWEAENVPIRVWDMKTGKELANLPSAATVLRLAASGDGSRIAVAPYTNSAGKPDPREKVTVWDVKTKKVLAEVPQGGDGGYIAFSPDGRLLAVSSRNKPDVRVYEVASGKERFHFKHKAEITSLAFAPDGRTLAAASYEAPVYLWDVFDGSGEPPAWDGKRAWADLASPDAAIGFRGVRAIRANTTAAVAFLKDITRLKPAPTAARFRELLADLGAKDFQTREEATAELASFGEVLRPELEAALSTATNAETARRLRLVLGKLDKRTDDGLRLARAVEAVEGLDPADGTPLLKAWASGLCGERLATEAKAALARRE